MIHGLECAILTRSASEGKVFPIGLTFPGNLGKLKAVTTG